MAFVLWQLTMLSLFVFPSPENLKIECNFHWFWESSWTGIGSIISNPTAVAVGAVERYEPTGGSYGGELKAAKKGPYQVRIGIMGSPRLLRYAVPMECVLPVQCSTSIQGLHPQVKHRITLEDQFWKKNCYFLRWRVSWIWSLVVQRGEEQREQPNKTSHLTTQKWP